MMPEPSDLERSQWPEATTDYVEDLEERITKTIAWLETAIEDLDFSGSEDALVELKEGNGL